uniref:Lipid transferase CIDEA n=1 Tax=Bos taurus TaxID=9913 RepID=A0AAA9SFU2_BOVIN
MGSQTKKVLFTPFMHPARPFRVSNHDRSSRRGVMASSLQELLSKTLDALVVASQLVTLVLEEDGTVVDTEEFFQTLGDNTHLMVLEQGQKWTPLLQEDHVKMLFINLGFQRSLTSPNPKGLKRTESESAKCPQEAGHQTPARRPPQRRGIAKVTFDLYKLSPKDVIGCLNVKATMYEMYSVSYDIHCTGFKAMLRSLLRFLSHAAQVTGQCLIHMGTYMLRVLAETEEQAVPGSRPWRGIKRG